MNEKLQKVLARAGLGSRREMERWIEQGRIKVNNQVATLGDRVTDKDTIKVDNRILKPARTEVRHQVIAYHKPVGEVCSRDDPEGRPTIYHNLPRLKGGRWISIGRLDLNTSGLLLLTTDGELANRLMHPSHGIEREYAVRILGEVSDDILQQLKTNVPLEDGDAHFASIKEAGGSGANHWYHVVLKEGRNREVRRLWEYFGFAVSRLMRIRYGAIRLEKRLRPGKTEALSDKQMRALYDSVGLRFVSEAERAEQKARTPSGNKGNRAVYRGKARTRKR